MRGQQIQPIPRFGNHYVSKRKPALEKIPDILVHISSGHLRAFFFRNKKQHLIKTYSFDVGIAPVADRTPRPVTMTISGLKPFPRSFLTRSMRGSSTTDRSNLSSAFTWRSEIRRI